jgi:hypothetical protein
VGRFRTRFKLVTLTLAALSVVGCVSTRVDNKSTDNGNGYYVGGRDASVDAAVAITELPASMTPLTPELRNQLMDSSCSAWYGEGQSTGTALELIVDVSSSMSATAANTGSLSKWDVARSALQDLVDHLPQSTQLGVLFFPNCPTSKNDMASVDGSSCVNVSASIPIGTLGRTGSVQRQLIAERFKTATPQGGTPTEDAISLALSNSVVPAVTSQPGAQTYMILLTDGQPTISGGCRGQGDESTAVDYQPIIELISEAWSNYGALTFVIGAPGSDRDVGSGSDVRYWLSHAASAGHTPITSDCSDTGLPNFCHYDMSQVPDFTASFERALQTITGLVLSCSFALPSLSEGDTVDPSALNVIYGANDAQNQELLVARTDASCTSDGWYLDSTNSVVLCPKACATIQQNPNAEVHIVGGCKSIITIN